MSSTLTKDGPAIRKRLVFCQKILTREEFSRFCDGMREISIYSRETNTSFDRSINRLIVPVDDLDVFPEFSEKYQFINTQCEVSWDANYIGKNVPFLGSGEALLRLQGLNVQNVVISVDTKIAELVATVLFIWNVSDGVFLQEALMSLDPSRPFGKYEKCVVDDLDYSGFPAYGFSKSMLGINLSFLRGIRLKPDGRLNIKVDKRHLNELWKLFVEWAEGEGKKKLKRVEVSFNLEKAENHCWNADLVRDVVAHTGGKEVCLDLSLGLGNAKGNTDFEQEYHQWLAKIVGLRTLSGSAARYVVGAICTGGYGGEIWSYFVPEGVCLGYIEFDRRPKMVPEELAALLPGVEWIRGMLPGGDSFPFPIYGVDEHNDPLPSADIKTAIKTLRSEVRKWKARQTPPRHGSLEEQIETLATIGIKMRDSRDIDDVLDYRGREWYEDVPYIHLLIRIGILESDLRMIYADMDQVSEGISVSELLNTYDLIHIIRKQKGVDEKTFEAGRSVVFFTVDDKEHRWELSYAVKRLIPEILGKYDALLQQQTYPDKNGYRLYSIATGVNSMILGAFRTEEVERFNTVLPVPFTLCHP